jgi:hypothetical protein
MKEFTKSNLLDLYSLLDRILIATEEHNIEKLIELRDLFITKRKQADFPNVNLFIQYNECLNFCYYPLLHPNFLIGEKFRMITDHARESFNKIPIPNLIEEI